MNYKLTATEVKNAKPLIEGKARRMSDGNGLRLYISTKGTKSWQFKYRLGGEEHLYTIGIYPQITLASAREQHAKAYELVQQGKHPLAQKKAEKLETSLELEDTFKAIASAWIETKEASCSPYYCRQIKTAMANDVYSAIGNLPIRTVKSAHILALLKKVTARGAPVVAINIKQWCSAVFCYAVANLKADYDPTAVLKGVISRPKIKHNVALKPSEITELLKQMEKYGPYRTTAIAIELLLLTFVRTAELRKATWNEFDFTKSEWRIPAERMKMKKAHVVPLSTQALAFLVELKGVTGSSPHLFPNYRRPSDYMTPTTINQALKRVGFSGAGSIGFSAHGFRGTATTILYEKSYRTEVIEKQLAHAEGNKTKASYNQAQYLSERKVMMQEWADYIDNLRPCVKGIQIT